ncbi:helitron_like_N domain-containing protein [Trichonephila clavipes]|nr:helitron_like_N domain-containing protein [Trichonephila clavipes]
MASQSDIETVEAAESGRRAVAEKAQQRRSQGTHRVTSDNYKVVIHPDHVPRGEHERRFNVPTTNEIAAVVVISERTASRDIVIQAHDDRLTRVRDTHRFYDAVEYPFLVDMYVKVESERLRFIAFNQTKPRAENYIHLQDAIRNDADLDPNNLG